MKEREKIISGADKRMLCSFDDESSVSPVFFVIITGVTINNQQQCKTSRIISSRKNDPLILQAEEKIS